MFLARIRFLLDLQIEKDQAIVFKESHFPGIPISFTVPKSLIRRSIHFCFCISFEGLCIGRGGATSL